MVVGTNSPTSKPTAHQDRQQTQQRPDPWLQLARKDEHSYQWLVFRFSQYGLVTLFPGPCDGLMPLVYRPSFPSTAGVGREAGRPLSNRLGAPRGLRGPVRYSGYPIAPGVKQHLAPASSIAGGEEEWIHPSIHPSILAVTWDPTPRVSRFLATEEGP